MGNDGEERGKEGFDLTTLGGFVGRVINERDVMFKDEIMDRGFRDKVKRAE